MNAEGDRRVHIYLLFSVSALKTLFWNLVTRKSGFYIHAAEIAFSHRVKPKMKTNRLHSMEYLFLQSKVSKIAVFHQMVLKMSKQITLQRVSEK